MIIYLARHGETNLNKEGKFQGISDFSLNDKGIKYANKLKKFFSNKKLDEVFSSNLKRSKETAKIISNDFKIEKNLHEISGGIFEGKTLDEQKSKYPKEFQARINDKYNFVIPKGESYKTAKKRIEKLINKIIKKNYDEILIVGHQGINRIILQILTNMEDKEVVNYDFGFDFILKIDTEKKTKRRISL
ncbi:histidine phosphatase family protein [Candidatus Woesearchaeota archaeon]|nr:histidine phosphatase family protein [Candidatus Woesearchaeota archaeon]